MDNVYLLALTESLEKKIEILKEIRKKDAEQYDLIIHKPFSIEAFDRNSNEKGVLIYKLNKLDEGFQVTYDNVSEEIKSNKEKYRIEIMKMQDLISEITALSTSIQADEMRNKRALERYFAEERNILKGYRSQSKAVKSYADAMKFTKN